MAKRLFLTLPREIRDVIYLLALTSPTGFVTAEPTMVPIDDEKTAEDWNHLKICPVAPPCLMLIEDGHFSTDWTRILPSLLRTCKQIYSETKHLFLVNDAFYIPEVKFPWDYFMGYLITLGNRMQHLCLRATLFDNSAPENLAALNAIAAWAKDTGKLKTFTLFPEAFNKDKIDHYDCLCFDDPEVRTRDNHYYWAYLDMLRRNRDQYRDHWVGVTKRIELEEFNPRDYQHVHDPMAFVVNLHDAFGGELWVGGRLCYRDGEQIERPMELVSKPYPHVVGGEEVEDSIIEELRARWESLYFTA